MNKVVKFNWKLLGKLCLALGVCAGLVFVLFAVQKNRLAPNYLRLADEHASAGDYRKATEHLFRYTKLYPKDAEGLYKLAESYRETANTEAKKLRATDIVRNALRASNRDDRKAELTEWIAQLYFESGRDSEALQAVGRLEEESPIGAKIQAMIGYRASRASTIDSNQRQTALGNLRNANRLLPNDIELAETTAIAIVNDLVTVPETERIRLADDVIDGLFSNGANANEPNAYLARFRFQELAGESSEVDLQKALELSAESSVREIVNICALAGSSQEPVTRGLVLAALEGVLEREPTAGIAYMMIGRMQLQDGAESAAIETWLAGLNAGLQAQSIDLRQELGRAYLRRREFDSAEHQLQAAKSSFNVYRSELRAASASPREIDRIGDTIDLLLAQTYVANGKPDSARPILDGLLNLLPKSGLGKDGELRVSALTTLANIEMLGNPQRAAELLAEASAASSDVDVALQQEAKRLQATGNFEASENVARASLDVKPNLEKAISLANIQLAKQSVRPASVRRWSEFDETLRLARSMRGASDAWQLDILQIARICHGEASSEARQKALALLTEAGERWQAVPGFWATASLLYQQLGRTDRATQAVDHFASLEQAEWEVARIRYRLSILAGDHGSALNAIDSALHVMPEVSRLDANKARATLLRVLGRTDEYTQTLLELHQTSPTDIEIMQWLAMSELDGESSSEFDRWIEKLQQAEGPRGATWRWVLVQRHLDRSGESDLAAAQKLIEELSSIVPNWPRLAVLRGRLLARKAQYPEALVQFETAMGLGIRDLVLIEEALACAFESQDVKRIEAYLDIARNSKAAGLLNSSISSNDVWRSRSTGMVDRLLDASDAKSPATRVFLAQLAVADGRRDDAEKLLVSANEQDATAQTQLALFSFYAGHDSDKAKAALEAAEGLLDGFTDAEREIFVGERLKTIGLIEEAETRFTQAVVAAPDDVSGHLQLARLYLNRDPLKAESALREVIRVTPNDQGSRHLLANLLARRGGFEEWAEVQSLLEGSDQVDNRLRVVLLIQRGGEQNIAEARKLLEALAAPLPSDRLILAVTLEADGDPESAKTTYEALLEDDETSFVSHRMFAEFCLRMGDAARARELTKTIMSISEDAPTATRLTSYDVRLRALAGELGQVAVIKEFQDFATLQKPAGNDASSWCRSIGTIYENSQLYTNAAEWWRQASESDDAALMGYCKVLARLNRHEEAVNLILEKAAEPTAPSVLVQLVEILSINSHQSIETWKRVDALIDECSAKSPDAYAPRFIIAMAATLKGKEQKAILLLSELLADRPNDVVVLNNLAVLMGQTEDGREQALKLIERAIRIAGPRPLLLDTKGMILVELGMQDDAIRELKHLAAIAAPDPRVLFRLAVAYMRGDNPDESRKLLLRANAMGLLSTVMTEFDKALLDELKESVL